VREVGSAVTRASCHAGFAVTRRRAASSIQRSRRGKAEYSMRCAHRDVFKRPTRSGAKNVRCTVICSGVATAAVVRRDWENSNLRVPPPASPTPLPTPPRPSFACRAALCAFDMKVPRC